mgnify:CR=1 FL=1
MSNREFQDWFLYEQIEPFGEKRDDLRAGILWSLLANIHRRKGASPIQIADYPLIKESKTQLETANELHAQFMKFKTRYESRPTVRQGEKIGA